MNLQALGFNERLAGFVKENDLSDFIIGRVTQEHRERYIVSTGEKEYDAEITGNLRFSAASRLDFPAVGDWVAMVTYDPAVAIINRILPRKSVLERQAVGKHGEKQIISTNVDVAFIVQSIDNNFNLNRLERYMAICYDSGIEPVLVVSKTDLAEHSTILEITKSIRVRHKDLKYLLLNNITKEGLQQVSGYMQPGHTYCIIGSSGVGKSTLINNLLNSDLLKTGQISNSTKKGKHTTDHRELIILHNGGIIIDTPGMKELGMTDNTEGIRSTFREIHNIALKCKFPDCTHIAEKGCAVIEARNNGIIDNAALENYQKILREQEHFSKTQAEKRKKDREFGKMCKNIMNEKKKNKF